MTFNLGNSVLALSVLAVLSGAWIFTHRPAPPAAMNVWVRMDEHATGATEVDPATGQTLVQRYEQQTGRSANIDVIAGRAMDVRLISIFMSESAGRVSPDLASVEISSVGKFFRPPVEHVGFLPLNSYLERSGWDKRIIASRFAPYSKEGRIFGVPFDVHPVSITYRKDLFDEAGIPLAEATTWPQFHQMCVRFQHYWRQRGFPNRAAIALPNATADYLIVMLLQRGINILDDRNQLHLSDSKVVDTLLFYLRCVAGAQKIGANHTPGSGLFVRDLADGHICSFITPDWRVDQIRNYGKKDLMGKLGMMPLPRFDPTDSRTATWGGTMIGILATCPDPDAAWNLLEHLYLSDEAMAMRIKQTLILPAVMDHWSDPAYHEPDPLFGGQKADALFVELAAELPIRYVTPFTAIATSQLSTVLNQAVARIDHRSGDDPSLEELCRQWLAEAEKDLARRIEFGNFSE